MMKNIKRINIEIFVKNIFNVENGCFQEEVNEIVNVYGRMMKEQVRAVECSDEAMISNTLNAIFKEMIMDAKMCGRVLSYPVIYSLLHVLRRTSQTVL